VANEDSRIGEKQIGEQCREIEDAFKCPIGSFEVPRNNFFLLIVSEERALMMRNMSAPVFIRPREDERAVKFTEKRVQIFGFEYRSVAKLMQSGREEGTDCPMNDEKNYRDRIKAGFEKKMDRKSGGECRCNMSARLENAQQIAAL
jgi:hypothetical protein